MTLFLAILLAAAGLLLSTCAVHSVWYLDIERRRLIEERDVWNRQADRNMNDLCEANRLLQEWILDHKRLLQRACEAENEAHACRHNLTHTSLN